MLSFMLIAYSALMATVFLVTHARHRDIMHPVIYFTPQLVFLYAFMPWTARSGDPVSFAFYVGGDQVLRYQLLAFLVSISLLMGIGFGSRRTARISSETLPRDPRFRAQLYRLGVLLSVIGTAAWIYALYKSGGFYVAYGRAYGGAGTGNGYLNELRYVGLATIPLIYIARRDKGMRSTDWLLILIAIAPLLTHGLLGARRGPTFLALAAVVGGWVYFFNKKVPLAITVAGGLTLGFLMLFLVSNRGAIYLGSDAEFNRGATAILYGLSGNEYVYGSAVMRYADATEGYFYGARILAHLIGRIIPGALWPTQFEDVQNFFNLEVNLEINAGIDVEGISQVVGWMPAIGAAPGFVAEFWLEFGVFAFVAAFAIGWLYGKAWRTAKTSEPAKVFYIVMMALSVYLLMQSLEAWSYRLLLFGVPVYLLTRFMHLRSRQRLHSLSRRTRMHAPQMWQPRSRPG